MYQGGRVAIRARLWLAGSVVLNALALEGIANRLIPIEGPLQAIAKWYSTLTGFFFAKIAAALGIGAHWHVPISDVLIFMGGFFAAANYFVLRSDGQSVLDRIRAIGCSRISALSHWTCVGQKMFVLYALGPLIYAYCSVTCLIRRRRYYRAHGFTFAPLHIVSHYTLLIISVCVLHALSAQFF
jgi:hypothetical protein